MLLDIFHKLIIPFLGGFVVTIGKLIAGRKLLTWDEANDIALDVILIALGALGAFYVRNEASPISDVINKAKDAVFDGGVVDAFIGAILLYLRAERMTRTPPDGVAPPVGALSGVVQLLLALFAIYWTISAF